MLTLNIKKNLTLLHPKNAAFFDLVHFSYSLSSAAASKTLNPPPKSHPIAEFLINSCGFSSHKAASATKKISKFSSVEQAASVRHFFEHHGFADTSIRKLISNYPRVLCASIDKTLQPNLQSLCRMGFTEAELELIVASNAYVLVNPLTIARLEFWQSFLGTNDKKDLVLAFKRNRSLLTHDIVSGIAPKIAFLKEHGLSQTDLIGILRSGRLFSLSFKSIEMLLKRAKELGFCSQTSSMLARGLSALCGIGSGEFKAKMERFRGFGWSEEEFLGALKKTPPIVSLSKDNIREKMEFLVGRVGCDPSYVASRPLLLTLSLEKRLIPRHYVMDILRTNGIAAKRNFYSIMCLPEKKFVEMNILPYTEQLPKIHENYLAACDGQILI